MLSDAPYSELSPETVLDAIEAVGHRCDGRVLALNSYENRVYQIGIEDGTPLVAKFYRPGRWTDAAIREEHAFAGELAAQEIPVVAPLLRDGVSLHVHHGFRYAVFPRRGGRWPELGTVEDREWVGRFLGRIHGVGRAARFQDRARLSMDELGRKARDFVLEGDWMPDYLADKYADVTDALLEEIEVRADGWRGAHPRAHSRRLSPRQYPVDGPGAALRRSRRLLDRSRHPGPVDAAGGRPAGNAHAAAAICSRATSNSCPSIASKSRSSSRCGPCE